MSRAGWTNVALGAADATPPRRHLWTVTDCLAFLVAGVIVGVLVAVAI